MALIAAGSAEVDEQADAYGEESGVDPESPSEEQLETVVTEYFVPSLESQAEQLRELGVPEGDEEEVDAILTALEGATEELDEDPALLFDAEANPLQEASELASTYGFGDCGE